MRGEVVAKQEPFKMRIHMGCLDDAFDIRSVMARHFQTALSQKANELVFIDPAFFGMWRPSYSWTQWMKSDDDDRTQNVHMELYPTFLERFQHQIAYGEKLNNKQIQTFLDETPSLQGNIDLSKVSVVIGGFLFRPIRPRMSIEESNQLLRNLGVNIEPFSTNPIVQITKDEGTKQEFKCSTKEGHTFNVRYFPKAYFRTKANVPSPCVKFIASALVQHEHEGVDIKFTNAAVFHGTSGLESPRALNSILGQYAQNDKNTIKVWLSHQMGRPVHIDMNDARERGFKYLDLLKAFELAFNDEFLQTKQYLPSRWTSRHEYMSKHKHLLPHVEYLFETNFPDIVKSSKENA